MKALHTRHRTRPSSGPDSDRIDAACDGGAGGWPHPSTMWEPIARRRGMVLMSSVSRFSAEERLLGLTGWVCSGPAGLTLALIQNSCTCKSVDG